MSIIREFVEQEQALTNAALPMFYKQVLDGNVGDDAYVRQEWRMEMGGDAYEPFDDDSETKENGQEFEEFVKNWCEERLSEAFWNISQMFFKTGTMRVYRVITAPEDWQPDNRHPGIYWSWDETAAEAHWGDYSDGNVNWQMTAEVKSDEIDWPITLTMNASPSFSEEKEIRLKEHTPVEILSCKRI